MSRWLVKLDGDPFDVEEFPRWFPAGEVRSVEQAGEFFLVSDSFESLSDAESVRSAAEGALVRMFGIGSLLVANLHLPVIADVIREHDDGRKDVHRFGIFEARGKSGAAATAVTDAGEPAGPTEVEKMLSAAHGFPHLENALELWGNGMLTWPRLYRIVEDVEKHLGTTVVAGGQLCTEGERERFRRSSNNAEVSGLDARHAAGQREPPRNPMTIADARAFVRSILRTVLTNARASTRR